MDYFTEVLTTFLGLGTFQFLDFIKKKKILISKIVIVLKINKGLDRHKGELLRTEFSFLGELLLKTLNTT